MSENRGDPVEISTRMRPGEWTTESIAEIVTSYLQKLLEMGAPENEIVTDIQQPDNGSASVPVSWKHEGIRTFTELVPSNPQKSKKLEEMVQP